MFLVFNAFPRGMLRIIMKIHHLLYSIRVILILNQMSQIQSAFRWEFN